MSKIFEIFGYPLTDSSNEAKECRKTAQCPFMGKECDGGGNRYLSSIDLSKSAALRSFFGSRTGTVCAGICSLQLHDGEAPWIVCPRRLLVLGREAQGRRAFQIQSEKVALGYLGYESGTRLGVWPEMKMKYSGAAGGTSKNFDYTFDYVIMPLGQVHQKEVEKLWGLGWGEARAIFERAGYTIARRGGEYFVEDAPLGIPSIIEIMTSSTSGGNKTHRTTIPMAFEDAILGRQHEGPGINYRQVWARMVSQLIVKSEVTLAWGGKTLWVVQDALVDYICSSTALNIRSFLASHPEEVNMLSFSYGTAFSRGAGVIELSDPRLFAGPIAPLSSGPRTPSFQDMVKAPICPPLSHLYSLLARRRPANTVLVT